ncbi:MAG: Osmosensitive channel histidine kinaselike protein [Actinomycetia bacterium]|nr:Osmosensitive channel histidine kinaselike protein [Actinomycetes bacterium]
MTRHLSRDRAAVLAGLLGPLAVAAILLPWRASWSNTNVALLLVVVVVAVAAIGNRIAGALAAVSAAIHGSADITTAVLLLAERSHPCRPGWSPSPWLIRLGARSTPRQLRLRTPSSSARASRSAGSE